MRGIRGFFVWIFMTNKRLYKKSAFITVLLLLVAMTLSLVLCAKNGATAVNVALVGGYEDKNLCALADKLLNEKSIIGYFRCESKDQALNMLKGGKVDTVWCFPDDLYEAAGNFCENKTPIVKQYVREDNVFLRLASEKLYSIIYKFTAKRLYLDNMHNISGGKLSEQAALKYYEDNQFSNDLIETVYPDSDIKLDDVNYITSPIRGLAALMVLASALSALMYFKEDKQNGMLCAYPYSSHIYIELAYIFVAALNAAVFALISIAVCGMLTEPKKEIISMLLYTVGCTAFSASVGLLPLKKALVGALIPIIVMLSVTLCPIFLNIKSYPALQAAKKILPTLHYLNAFTENGYVTKMSIYALAFFAVCFAANYIKQKIASI